MKPRAERRYTAILDDWDWLAGELETVRKRAHSKQLDSPVMREVDWYIANAIRHIGMSVASFDVSACAFACEFGFECLHGRDGMARPCSSA